MKWTQSLIVTSRQVPAEAEVPSHQLMIRAGYIRRVGAGIYTYLPLGWRSLQRAMSIVREEMNRAGASELFMPALEPMELFTDTKRDVDYGDNLFTLTDRHGRRNALGPTHEEVITDVMKAYVESYKQLPLNLYQIQTKFRDEFRPRFGVLRSREFLMKDAYSFHTTLEGEGGLDETYTKMYDAYCRIFDRCGLDYSIVEAESGPIGGSASHEFMVNAPVGEDLILSSDKKNYAANVERCGIGDRTHSLDGAAKGDLDKVHTPNLPGIDEVVGVLGCEPADMLKTIVWRWHPEDEPDTSKWVLAIVRGHHDVNEGKVRRAISDAAGRPVTLHAEGGEDEAKAAGFAIGYVSPAAASGRDDCMVIADPDAASDHDWASGADEPDHHVKHFNWKRDVIDRGVSVTVCDIRNATEGDPSPLNDGGTLVASRGIEVGHVFKLGTKYSEAMGFTVLDEKQKKRSVIMGCYGIGIGRILASAIELNHDDNGIRWPKTLAPFDVVITPIKYQDDMKETADRLEAELTDAGLDVLVDDRKERPGPKFKDADLIGIPIRLTVGSKALDEGCVEITLRDGSLGRGELVKLEDVVARCTGG